MVHAQEVHALRCSMSQKRFHTVKIKFNSTVFPKKVEQCCDNARGHVSSDHLNARVSGHVHYTCACFCINLVVTGAGDCGAVLPWRQTSRSACVSACEHE